MSNIVKFDEYTGIVFGTLYEAFPIPVDLSIKGITGESSADYLDFTHQEISTDSEIAFHSVQWLANTGYLSTSGTNGVDFFNVVLTEKGLEALRAIPESINSENLPLGARLAAAIKTGATETIIKLSAQTIAVGVKMAFNKIGLALS